MQQSLVFSGRVTAQARTDLAAPITGRVAAVRVREGDRVTAGQLLIQLDDQEARAQVEQAHAALASAQARLRAQGDVHLPVSQQTLAQARAQLDFARGTELEFVIMVIAVSCVKLLSAHNSTQHTSRKHKV
jgi:Multidrug resistance efflux pump